jgi:hypothetical protein
MKYAVEMGSGAMVHIPSFISIGSAIRKFKGGGGQVHRHIGSLEFTETYFHFFKIRKVD